MKEPGVLTQLAFESQGSAAHSSISASMKKSTMYVLVLNIAGRKLLSAHLTILGIIYFRDHPCILL